MATEFIELHEPVLRMTLAQRDADSGQSNDAKCLEVLVALRPLSDSPSDMAIADDEEPTWEDAEWR